MRAQSVAPSVSRSLWTLGQGTAVATAQCSCAHRIRIPRRVSGPASGCRVSDRGSNQVSASLGRSQVRIFDAAN
jgi:hypothetical protein